MKRVVPSRTRSSMLLALCAFVAMLVAAACAPDVSSIIISPELGDKLAAQLAGESIVREPTPIPPKLAELTPEQVFAGMDETLAAAVQAADPSGGPAIALAAQPNTCTACHNLDPTVVTAGPTWHNIGDTAVAHAGLAGAPGPAEYIHQSIINPGAFIVPNFPPGVMPTTYGDTLSDDDLATLIAFLLSQNGKP